MKTGIIPERIRQAQKVIANPYLQAKIAEQVKREDEGYHEPFHVLGIIELEEQERSFLEWCRKDEVRPLMADREVYTKTHFSLSSLIP